MVCGLLCFYELADPEELGIHDGMVHLWTKADVWAPSQEGFSPGEDRPIEAYIWRSWHVLL